MKWQLVQFSEGDARLRRDDGLTASACSTAQRKGRVEVVVPTPSPGSVSLPVDTAEIKRALRSAFGELEWVESDVQPAQVTLRFRASLTSRGA